MMDLVTLMLLSVGMHAAVRIADALALSMTLRARARLIRAAASLPPGVALSDCNAPGVGWLVRNAEQLAPWARCQPHHATGQQR
jgi:hypothetical protein